MIGTSSVRPTGRGSRTTEAARPAGPAATGPAATDRPGRPADRPARPAATGLGRSADVHREPLVVGPLDERAVVDGGVDADQRERERVGRGGDATAAVGDDPLRVVRE